MIAFHNVGVRRAITMATLLPLSLAAMAQDAEKTIDKGDTAWLLISTALVLLMTPGLALFYGGMVRRKNVLGTMMHSFMAMAVVSIIWVLVGYSLAFGPSINGIIGSLDWFGLRGVGGEPSDTYAVTVPHLIFMAFQMMFAIITPALIFGAVAERMKFKAYLLFLVLWSIIIYSRWPTGCGAAAGWAAWARWTLPAAWWSIFQPALRH